jgi:2-dehydropantoate 2-reductase
MRVLVMGTGGVGGLCGALLAQQGHEVTFVARGPHLAALRERGLELRSGGQVAHLRPVRAVAVPAEAEGPAELVLFTVKTYDTDGALEVLAPVIQPDTAVLTLQNGVESGDRLSARLGAEHVLVGTTLVFSAIVEPGVIEAGPLRRITLGEPSGAVTPRVEAIAAALRTAGFEVNVTTDPRRAVWEKFVPLAAHATITSACQLAVGPVREAPEGAAMYQALIDETVAVGRASGVELAEDAAEAAMALMMSIPANARNSMERDYSLQRRVELEQLTGTVVRRGHELGVPTPVYDTLYAILRIRALAFGGLA